MTFARLFAVALLLSLAACSGSAATSPDAGTPPNADLSGFMGTPPDLSSVPPPPTPAIEFIGRFDNSDPAGPKFAWSGSTIRVRFSGTQLTLKLKDPSQPGYANTYTIVVDGGAPTQLTADGTKSSYPIATGLAAGTHEVAITRNTEAFVGVAQFLGFDYGPGGALLAPTPRGRRIELIGDSITCGYGDEGADQNCKFSTATEDNFIAYGSVAARALDADAVTLAWSGKGVYRNNDSSMTETMPILWKRTLPADPQSAWSFATPPPDAVVINLATNDFAPGTPDEKGFVAAYQGLLSDVRARYPSAHIFAALGPMLGGAELASARTFINEAIANLHDAQVQLIEFPTQDGSTGFGCDWHPSAQTHQAMGTQLAAAIKSALGW
jgi:lysophospholipase L1-like esterase